MGFEITKVIKGFVSDLSLRERLCLRLIYKFQINEKFFKFWPLIILISLGFFTRFWRLYYPPNVVFDETHFGLYATKYLSGQYYFDIHPPLGKMLYALIAFLVGIKPGFCFEENSAYGEFNYLALRMLPAFIGVLFILSIYFFCQEIGFSSRVAFLASFLLLFENALVVESRLILLNVFLLFFIFSGLFLFLVAQKCVSFSKKWYFLNTLCGFCLGAASSIKWSGWGTVLLVLFLAFFRKELTRKEIFLKLGFFLLIPLLTYFLVFYFHFKLLPLSCTQNCGWVLDKILETHPDYTFFTQPPKFSSFLGKFFDNHLWMIGSNFSFFRSYSYAFHFSYWPLMIRPIPYFFEKTSESKTSYIYLIGNPLVWWLGTFGIVCYFSLLLFQKIFKKEILDLSRNFPKILIFGYFVFWLPFALVKRFLLLYLYFPALVFSIIIFSELLDRFLRSKFSEFHNNKQIFYRNKKANLILLVVLLLVVIGFLFFSPLTYGLPLTEKQFNARMWGSVLWEPISS